MKCEATLILDGKAVEIITNHGKAPSIRMSDTLTGDQLKACNCITEVLKCLSNGKDMGVYFNPTVDHDFENEVMKCRWERSGSLVVIGPADQMFLHAETVEQAISRNRTFTCTRAISRLLPGKRG